MNKIWLEDGKIQYSFLSNIIKNGERIIINEDVEVNIDINNYSGKLIFEINNSNVLINVIGDNNNIDISYFLNNSELLVQKLVVNNSDNVLINLDSDNSKVTYNYSSINYTNNTYSIKVNHNSSNTESYVINHGVNVSSNKLMFDVSGFIPKKSINCKCNQDNRIINLNDNSDSTIKPNLIIDNNMIEANHAAYIGDFKEQDVFYLQSRGLSKKDCYDLLLKAYLIGNFNVKDERYLEKINSIGGE